MNLSIPELSLVVLCGASGSGKSSFARAHFKPTEVLSSDTCRGWVSDDENNLDATDDAFDALHYVARKRLARGLLTVIDATNVRPEDRRALVALAREHHCLPVAIVLDLPERTCHDRNAGRPDRRFGPHVVKNQRAALRRGMGRGGRDLRREGFRQVFVLETEEEVAAATVERVPLWNNKKQDHGPFDLIGDVHGCCDELEDLLGLLGYVRPDAAAPFAHPAGRRAVFVGDLVDRGPRNLDALRLVMAMVGAGSALCVPGNHDEKLLRKLMGKDVRVTHGFDKTLAELDALPPESRAAELQSFRAFLDSLVSHYVFDDGRLVVAHAGLKEAFHGRGSGAVREFAVYGDTTGEMDELGLPVRLDWAADYRGRALVVYGHTPVAEPRWLNGTVNIDTGCVFGGALTALRWPERETVSVPARAAYADPGRPFLPDGTGGAPIEDGLTPQQANDDVLDLEDVSGKRIVETRLQGAVTVRAENATAALEVMSRFAADPRWLVYLPPTMSPVETSDVPGFLERPEQAFEHFRDRGVGRAVCEEKHMGSRAVAVVCRDADAARRRFGVATGESGVVYTRTGRRFFDDPAVEAAVLDRVAAAAGASGVWEELATDWLLLDCELMPWSAKAQALLREQYAAVGSAATAATGEAAQALAAAASRTGSPEVAALADRFAAKREMATKFVDAYRRYCWPVAGVDDLRLAPFHVLASEGGVHADRDHLWHMATIARLAAADPTGVVMATPHLVVDLGDPASAAAGAAWWDGLVGRGGEGMVVKPIDFVARGPKGLIQPALKVRGPEYLRIIYGPEYSAPENLARLRARGLSHKRSLALREFALGVEGLERFARREPLRRVHECAFAVLALESEPVDPRL